MNMAKKDPWTDPDPQPGDFDDYLAEVDPRDVQTIEAGSGIKVIEIGTNDVDGWLRRRRAERERKAAEGSQGTARSQG